MKALVEAGKVKATASAFSGARELGIDNLAGMCAVVISLTPANFHKSMTSDLAGRVPHQDRSR
ncbi:MAG TPA: type II toxin-antitoxin system MqsR family toxin [Immundisolibacter sp.]|nr:type II toxin-antitoxin system MqsR family toxin [Immundisolibacter sp.]